MNRQDVLERKATRLREIIIKLIMATKAGNITIHWHDQDIKLGNVSFPLKLEDRLKIEI